MISQRSTRLDAIRGVAILLILFGHYASEAVFRRLHLDHYSNMTWTGVDLFFILSGFLLGGIVLRNRESPHYFVPFYGRRMIRILPLYAVLVALFLLVWRSAEPIAPLITFTQNIEWAWRANWGPETIAPTWSLAVEEQFYLVLPLLVRYAPRRALPWLLCVLIAIAPLVRAICLHFGYPFAAYYLMPSRMDSLFLGVLIAWAARQESVPWLFRPMVLRVIAGGSGAAIVALIFANLKAFDPVMAIAGYTTVAVCYGSLFALAVQLKEPDHPSIWLRPLALFGLCAYSLYLFHMPILVALSEEFGPSLPTIGSSFVIVCAIAWLARILIEKPCIALGHRLLKYRSDPEVR